MPSSRASLASVLFVLAVAPAPSDTADDAAVANRALIEAHVRDIAERLSGPDKAAPVTVVEQAPVSLRPVEGRLEISTGLLGLLSSDAQLAMLVGYEQARASAATSAEGPRRKGRAAIRRDDAALIAALEASISAGFAADQALLAWSRLEPARSLGAPTPGALGDLKADRQRLERGRRWLESASGSASGSACVKAHPEARIGEDEYAREVRARLHAWRILTRPVVAADAASEAAWLTYKRSGGITGWLLNLSVESSAAGEGGRSRATESRRGSVPLENTLSAGEMLQLRALVAQALASPARQADAGLGSLRDGQVRSLQVREGERSRTITLSDGYELFPWDRELLQRLEALAR